MKCVVLNGTLIVINYTGYYIDKYCLLPTLEVLRREYFNSFKCVNCSHTAFIYNQYPKCINVHFMLYKFRNRGQTQVVGY